MIFLKTPEEIRILNKANMTLDTILNYIESHICVGENTQTLDDIANNCSLKFNVTPSFKGYRGFPKALCVSINEEIVHGIPSSNRILQNGDVVSIDFGLNYKGFHADAARTIIVGQTDKKIIDLVKNTRHALMSGVEQMCIGNRLQDISKAIEKVAKEHKYGNIKKMCGHGIGRHLHEEPQVLNYVDIKSPNIRLQEGLVLAIEPMFTLGTSDIKILNDGWTVATADKSIACHWELSVAIVAGKPFILGKQ